MRAPLTWSRWLRTIAVYGAVGAGALCIAPWFGQTPTSPRQVLAHLFSNAGDGQQALIFVQQRVPRVLLGFLVGAALGMAGAAFQVLLRNPLATPYTLGVASAGALTAAVSMSIPALCLAWGPLSSVYLYSLAGSGVAAAFIHVAARRMRHRSTNTLVLAGVAVNLFCGSVLLLVRFLADPGRMVSVDRWLMGGLATVGYWDVCCLVPFVLAGSALIMQQSHALNQLAFGEDVAGARGVQVERVTAMVFVGGVLLTAGAVAVAGPVGFVGLVVPHCVRMLSGSDQRIVLPASGLLAGALLVACDTCGRTCVSPTEIPVGIITACIGAPVFLVLLMRQKT